VWWNLENLSVNIFENRLTFDEVTSVSLVSSFFMGRGIVLSYLLRRFRALQSVPRRNAEYCCFLRSLYVLQRVVLE